MGYGDRHMWGLWVGDGVLFCRHMHGVSISMKIHFFKLQNT